MKQGKTKEDLKELLLVNIDKIRHDKKIINKIKKEMGEYNIPPGRTQKLINEFEELSIDLDLRVLCLLTEQVYLRTGDLNIKFDEWFTEPEIKTSKTYDYAYETGEEKIEFPYTFHNVMRIDDENYMTHWDIKFANKLFSQILRYNFDTQREAKYDKKIGQTVKLYPASLKDITSGLLKETLEITTITINALLGTSTSEKGELTYDHKKMELTVNEGAFLDILDGMHRLTGARNALEINPDINHTWQVSIKNFNLSRAAKYVVEISKQNAINKSHAKALEKARYADNVLDYLKRESDLKNRISRTEDVHYTNNEIVSYDMLADTIEEQFIIKSKIEADRVVGKYLAEFFDYLIGTHTEEFIESVNKVRKESLVNANVMFSGYIVLAKRMQQDNIAIENLSDILDTIDFSRENEMWREIGVLDDNKRIAMGARKKVKEYFNNIKIGEIVNG